MNNKTILVLVLIALIGTTGIVSAKAESKITVPCNHCSLMSVIASAGSAHASIISDGNTLTIHAVAGGNGHRHNNQPPSNGGNGGSTNNGGNNNGGNGDNNQGNSNSGSNNNDNGNSGNSGDDRTDSGSYGTGGGDNAGNRAPSQNTQISQTVNSFFGYSFGVSDCDRFRILLHHNPMTPRDRYTMQNIAWDYKENISWFYSYCQKQGVDMGNNQTTYDFNFTEV